MARPRDLLRSSAQKDEAIPSHGGQVPAQRWSERSQTSQDERKPHTVQEDQSLPSPSKQTKRLREAVEPKNHVPTGPPHKQLRLSPLDPSPKQTLERGTVNRLSASQQSQISHWAEQNTWPEDYFAPVHRMYHPLAHLLARERSSASLRRKQSEISHTSSVTPSDQRPREEKSAPYQSSSYPYLLERLGNSYMDESPVGVSDASKALLEDLLKRECTTPKGTLFDDNVFHTACRNVRNQNEPRIILDFTRLLVPSPESLAAFGATDLDILVESVNAGWNNSVPITSTRPQPDFAVGFGHSAFSDAQLSQIQPLLGDYSSLSYFRATWSMFFPFLTCEVKSGSVGLNLADRQNAHSMTLAVRGIVEFFKLGKREKEVHRELLTFSISHDHQTVRLFGYYPVFDGPETKIYRHKIHAFDFTALDGKEKWTTYKFTVAVYHHSLTLLKRIRSLVDDLPPDFALKMSQQSESQLSGPSELSQQFEDQELAETPNSQLGQLDSQQVTPDTSTQAETSSGKKKQRQV